MPDLNPTPTLDAFDRMLAEEARQHLAPYDEHGRLRTELTPAETADIASLSERNSF